MSDHDHEAYLNAMADQLDAAYRTRKSELFESYLTGPGPDEPENEPLRCWEESGVWCAVLEGPVGGLCGYARLPDGHPWIGLHYGDEIPAPVALDRDQPAEQAMDDHGVIPVFLMSGEDGIEKYERTLAVPVHGGLTWAGPMPVKGAPHGWWLGFDCGHAGDAIDPERYKRRHPWAQDWTIEVFCRRGHVWSEEEVALEIKRMVTPILAATGVRVDG